MTKAAHTPGPWKVDVFTTAILIESRVGCICEMPSDHGQHAERRVANARLIAAAPELLEALEDLDWGIGNGASDETWDAACAKARAAIAKAKGGSFNDPLEDKTVIVEVLGGVANVKDCPPGVTVNIIDYDIARGTPEDAEGSDSSDLLEAAEAVLAAWEQGDLAAAVRWLDSAVGAAKGGGA
jgi:hypothetical protein